MELEIFGTSASLGSPAVALKYLLPKLPIGILGQQVLRCLESREIMILRDPQQEFLPLRVRE
jgi:hypothetical protein